jgi:hypothetical protein
LIAAKQYEKALEICLKNDVMISEELASKILIDKSSAKYNE